MRWGYNWYTKCKGDFWVGLPLDLNCEGYNLIKRVIIIRLIQRIKNISYII